MVGIGFQEIALTPVPFAFNTSLRAPDRLVVLLPVVVLQTLRLKDRQPFSFLGRNLGVGLFNGALDLGFHAPLHIIAGDGGRRAERQKRTAVDRVGPEIESQEPDDEKRGKKFQTREKRTLRLHMISNRFR